MRSVWGLSIVGSLLLVCLSLPSLAQTITGTITGNVTDASGAVIANFPDDPMCTFITVSVSTNASHNGVQYSS